MCIINFGALIGKMEGLARHFERRAWIAVLRKKLGGWWLVSQLLSVWVSAVTFINEV